jgi:hypothetical protein
MRLASHRRIVAATLVFFVVEWLLFELVRIPYNPPRDMLTFLGQEKYTVLAVMGFLALGWTAYVLWDGVGSRPTSREALAFACLLIALTAAAAIVICYPLWTVTPLDLLFE